MATATTPQTKMDLIRQVDALAKVIERIRVDLDEAARLTAEADHALGESDGTSVPLSIEARMDLQRRFNTLAADLGVGPGSPLDVLEFSEFHLIEGEARELAALARFFVSHAEEAS